MKRRMKTLLALAILLSDFGFRISSFAALPKVRANGAEVSVIEHRVRGRLNCAYAHFTMAQAAAIEVTLTKPVGRIVLSPASRSPRSKLRASQRTSLSRP